MADARELDAGRRAAIEERRAAVDTALASRDYAGAVTTALDNPPAGTKSADIKMSNAVVVLTALSSVKESHISSIVKALSVDQQDILMKYVYKGLGMKEFQGEPATFHGKLFKWHSATVKRAGVGCILRAMSRKTL